MSFLSLQNVTKSFGGPPVLAAVNLSISRGEFVAIVGYSGSGKTTLISLIAGLLKPDSGTVKLNDLEITAPGPDRGVVFQNYSLLPWLTVTENIALAVNQVSEVVQGAFGPVLLRVTEIKPEIVRPYEEVAAEIRKELALAEAARVLIDVHDSGPGLSEEVSATLFEPTITFKKRGMGLGLSIAKKNALLSGGDVTVIPGALGGAGFRVSLPS